MTNHNQMSQIYSKFGRAGFNLSYIRRLLPDWWDEKLADTPSVRQYACLHLARMFSILPDSLKDGIEWVCFNFGGNHKYKHRQNVAENDLDIATLLPILRPVLSRLISKSLTMLVQCWILWR